MAWELDRRYNFFFSPPAHLCAVTYMTEISLIVTLNNQFNSTQLKAPVPDRINAYLWLADDVMMCKIWSGNTIYGDPAKTPMPIIK